MQSNDSNDDSLENILNQFHTHPTVSKNSLYKQLVETYFLPPRDSKGVNLKYLKKVKEGSVFRVNTIELKRYMADLRPSDVKKANYTHKTEAYKKINILLKEIKQNQLGFEKGIIPDGTWLYQVSRFIDPWNVCNLFKVSLTDPLITHFDSGKILLAKHNAKKYLLLSSNLLSHKEVKTEVKELTECHKKLVSKEIELENIRKYGEELIKSIEENKRILNNRLTECTLVILAAGDKKSLEEVMREEYLGKRKEAQEM